LTKQAGRLWSFCLTQKGLREWKNLEKSKTTLKREKRGEKRTVPIGGSSICLRGRTGEWRG